MTSRQPPPEHCPTPDPSQQVWAQFKAALDALAPEVRAAFLLHHGFGLPPDDIAILIGQPADACRHMVELARRAARERIPLQAEHGVPPSS
jgi:RNA polymerase sigma-70 factor (ECF subfamily)